MLYRPIKDNGKCHNRKKIPMKNKISLALLASTAFLAMSSSAFALDGNDVLAKLNAVLATGGSSLKADSVVTDGDTVTLTGTKMMAQGLPEAMKDGLPVGVLTLEGIAEVDGGYTIEKVALADINVTQDELTITATDIAMNGVRVPATVTPGSLDSTLLYDSFHAGPVIVSNKGKEIVKIEESNATLKLADDKSAMDMDFALTGIAVDLTGTPDPKMLEAIDKLGLNQINGEVTMKANWTLADGKMDISEYAFDFENIGRLNINFGLTGYTLDFIKALQEATKAAQANPDAAAGQQALMMSMMGMMQQLSYTGASIRFDDAGITAKALEYAGSQQGVDGAQMATSLKAMVPLMIGQLNMPDLQAQIVSATNAYLDDPKSIEISSKPAAPIPFPQIMGAAMAPQSLPQLLGVKITANE